MIPEEKIDLLTERLQQRVNKANRVFLKKIGNSIKELGKLTPSKAQQLIQILKYGGNYEEIVREMSKILNMNIKDIDSIFENYAKQDQHFYKQFYEYRNVPFVEYDMNLNLRRQTLALANITKGEMSNYARTNALGYTIKDLDGKIKTLGLRDTYNKVLDQAVLNVGQGKETFDEAMRSTLNQLGSSGLRTLDYENRSMRLDSAVRMHLKGALRELHNENQRIFGEEFDADGVEITVHLNPAPDHAEAQGRQFSNDEYDKLQDGKVAKDYTGKTFSLDHDDKGGYRPISTMNCYHTIFSIILGVNKPEYSEEQLQQIIDDNNKGFELDGKHYTNYQGIQLQRALERKIREQKDVQILAVESDSEDHILQTQQKITKLTRKYRELSRVSGLSNRIERAKVSGYRRRRVK